MWQHRFTHDTDLSVDAIWPVIADVARWPEVDRNIEALEISGTPGPGVAFVLKPKGGPRLGFTIGAFDAPHAYSDICRMPLARMETTHRLAPRPEGGTRLVVEIAITGPLARLWGLVVGRKHAAGLPAQTQRILARAAAQARSAA